LGDFLAAWLSAVWFVLVSSGPYLLLGFLIAGLLKTLVPERWIVRHIGDDSTRSVAIASLLGLPLPMCSCSVIPTAMQLRRSGASRGATTSFLVSAPEIGVESVGVTWALMDPLMTILRPFAAFFTAFVSGTLVNGLVRRNGDAGLEGGEAALAAHAHDHEGHDHGAHGHAHAPPAAAARDTASAEAAACCPGEEASVATAPDSHDDEPRGPVLPRVLRYAFGTLLDDLAPWLILGFLLSGLIVVLVPSEFFTGESLLQGWTGMFAMLIAGVPLYICASASTPVAAALMAKGLEPGAALVLLLAGPATNIATILVVRNLLGRQVLIAYLVSIAACSLALGYLANALYPFLGLDPTAMRVGDVGDPAGPIAALSGGLVTLLVLRSAWRQRVDLRFGRALGRFTAPLGFDPNHRAVRLAVVATVALAYASTGLSVVRPGEAGFLVRFGRVLEHIEGPAHRFHAPWPFTRLELAATGELRQRSYGLADGTSEADPIAAQDYGRAQAEHERLAAEAEVLTRDEYLLAIGYTVRYRVVDAHRWRFRHEAPDHLVGALAEGAMRSAASRLGWREVLHDRARVLEREVLARLVERVGALQLGCEVVAVDVRSVQPPGRVRPAFREVQSAEQDRATLRNRTLQQIAQQRARTSEEVDATVGAARQDALRETGRARGEATSLAALGAVYETRPTAVAEVLRFERLLTVIAGKTLVVLLDPLLRMIVLERSGVDRGTMGLPRDIFEGPARGAAPARGADPGRGRTTSTDREP